MVMGFCFLLQMWEEVDGWILDVVSLGGFVVMFVVRIVDFIISDCVLFIGILGCDWQLVSSSKFREIVMYFLIIFISFYVLVLGLVGGCLVGVYGYDKFSGFYDGWYL